MPSSTSFHLRIPATSANLGPGFDALGLAMALYLTIEAVTADRFAIDAFGRDSELCGNLEHNLILSTYKEILSAAGLLPRPLNLTLENEIPLGMGCGSSAAALLAGVFLADHFGQLGWTPQQILDEACRREGHPDNVAACFFGGMTASATASTGQAPSATVAASFGHKLDWRLLLAIPRQSLSTLKARALLPDVYTRRDAVSNVQSTALLVSAFALDRPDLLRIAMCDRLHQPFRIAACPLLPLLLPFAGEPGIHGVALSGAGPSVLLIAAPEHDLATLRASIRHRAGDPTLEVLETRISNGAVTSVNPRCNTAIR